MSTILVVDDEVRAREQFYDALTRKGHTVVTAGTGVQALEMLKAQRPQLVVLDLILPGLSGLETAHRIRAFDEDIPIVILKGPGPSSVAPEELARLGIAEVVQKDQDLAGIVDRLIPHLVPHDKPGAANARALGLTGTMLVVDDDHKVQELLRAFFEAKGLRVVLASSGEEGLKALVHRPVIVLLDVNMPGMDGVMALRKIKEQQPALPVVMISGGGEEVMARAALASGAYDYVQKPFNLEYLETVVLTKVLLGMEERGG